MKSLKSIYRWEGGEPGWVGQFDQRSAKLRAEDRLDLGGSGGGDRHRRLLARQHQHRLNSRTMPMAHQECSRRIPGIVARLAQGVGRLDARGTVL
jgi:hypothetical protein